MFSFLFSKITWLQINSGPTVRGILLNYCLYICQKSGEQLLMQIKWRGVCCVAFVDFRKAFDCVSHAILLHKLNFQFGVQGSLLSWLTDYLTDRTQFSVVNGQHSTVLNVTCGIPQGSVLGPTLFALYTNDLPSAVTSGSVFMYADDTTVYCIGDTVDNTVTSLNKALSELNSLCLENSLTPHSAKCEAMLLMRKPHIGPLNSVTIGEDRIEWVKHSRLLGVTIDERLSWSHHLTGPSCLKGRQRYPPDRSLSTG